MHEKYRNKAVKRAVKTIYIEPTWSLEMLQHYFEMMYDIGYHKGKRQCAHSKQVEQLKCGKVVATYKSVTHAALVTGFNKSTISKHIKNQTENRKGSRFRFKKVGTIQ